MGAFNPRSKNFEQLLEDTFPQANARVKTAIMLFLQEQILKRKIPRAKYFDLSRFLSDQRKLYDGLKQKLPNLPFVKAFETTELLLKLDEFLAKTHGGKIAAADLVAMLEQNPDLITHVTDQELETALDATRDHRLAMRIEQIKRQKLTPPPPTTPRG